MPNTAMKLKPVRSLTVAFNPDETAILTALRRRQHPSTVLSLVEILPVRTDVRHAITDERRVLNAIRRPVALGLIRRLGGGLYEVRKKTRRAAF